MKKGIRRSFNQFQLLYRSLFFWILIPINLLASTQKTPKDLEINPMTPNSQNLEKIHSSSDLDSQNLELHPSISIEDSSGKSSLSGEVPSQENLKDQKKENLPLEGLTYKDLYRDFVTVDQKWAILKQVRQTNKDFARKVYLACLKSDDWVLRSGGLQFLASLDPLAARPYAIKFLKEDPALVVRSAALKVLEDIGIRNREYLWGALRSSRNFHKGESLWIRKKLAWALFKMTNSSEIQRWMPLLSDSDPEVVAVAVSAMEKNSGSVLGKMSDSLSTKVRLWKSKYKF